MKKKHIKYTISFFTAALLVFPVLGWGQNINKSNKMGPMGTQVNTLSGNLFVPRTDFSIASRGFNLNIAFSYNSYNYTENLGFGNGWSFSYAIKYRNDTAGAKIIIWGDGREDTYTSAGGGNYQSPTGFFTSFSEYQPGKFSLAEPDGTKFFFDDAAHKRITKITEPNGNFLSFQYTDTLLTTISSAAAQTISLTYTNGKLTSLVDANASPTRTYTYSYDAAGNLTQVKDPLNGTMNYTYLVNGPMKTMQDKNKNVLDIVYYNDFSVSELVGCNKRISFSYDSATLTTYVTDYLSTGNNQVTRYEYKRQEGQQWLSGIAGNCCGFDMKFEFDARGNKIKETDANGNATLYTYDNRGNILTITDALGQMLKFSYSNDYNQITGFTDKKGFVSTITYDSKGNLIKLVDPGNRVYTATYGSNGDILTSTNPKGNVYTYSYDAYGNMVSVSGPNGYHASMTYDARGNLLSHTNANGNKQEMEYDILDRMKKITDPLNHTVQLNYDAASNLVSLVNTNNQTTLLGYDASNRVVALTDALGNKKYMSYNEMDNVKSVTDAKGNTTRFGFDTRDRLSSITDALGNTVNASYDPNGNIKSLSLPNGGILSYTYNALNRITSVSDMSGVLLQVSYDKNSNAVSLTNGTGAKRLAEFDSLNRVRKITDANGNAVTFAYDANGRILSTIDQNGNTTRYAYDDLNRVTTLTNQDGSVITLTYDAAGNITSAKDQNNNITSYAYDVLDRVSKVTYPDGRYIEYSYDKKGNVVASRLTDGTSITYQYDSLNRLTTKTLPDGQVYSYSYDAKGNVVSATNSTGTVSIAYDELDRIVSETFNGTVVRYSYNIAGRIQTIIYPDSTIITRNFDTRGRLLNVAKNNTVLVTYEYNNVNQVTKKTYDNGITSNYQYDFANRLVNLSTANGTIQNSVFAYDKKGIKTSVNRLNNPDFSEQFGYDNRYRLVNYKRGALAGTPTVENTYAYDAVGNRTAANLNGQNSTYTSNNLNQLTAITGSQNIAFTYDENGNRTYDGLFYKRYDAEGRLLKDSASPSTVLTYQYDAFGRRVQKTINGTSFKYTYSGLTPIEEKNATTNSLLNRTVFAGLLSPVLNERNNNAYFYHQNELNSIEAITNSAGNLSERYQYDVYGQPTIYDASNNVISSSITGNRFGLTGQEYDSATRSYHFHFRNYSPATGTFNQRDLIGYDDGMGMYQYVHNNPANGIDLFGLEDYYRVDGSYVVKEIDYWDQEVNVEAYFGKDPCYHDKNKIKLITKKIVEEEIANAISNAQENKKSVDDIGLGIGFINWLTGASWYQYGINSDSKFYNGNLANLTGENNYQFKGRNVKSWELNYYFTNSSLADAGFSEGAAAAYTQVWNDGKAYMSNFLQPWNAGKAADRLQESVVKQEMLSEAYRDYQAGGDNTLPNLPKELDYDNGVGDFGAFFPVINPRTGEISREFFVTRTIKRSSLEALTKFLKKNCPPNDDNGGTQKPRPNYPPGFVGPVQIISAFDPNEIIGPDGVGTNKWVSVKDRMPYTITFENDKSATAPAKFVRITLPVPEKADASTFQLGSFGFNNLTFTVPNGTSSHYQRLDARDSLGLYIDITAGYDPVGKQAFWEFQSIDPTTLLPPTNPLKGFLLLQDTSKLTAGHGFASFSLKPIASDNTGDTISAIASIVFDQNDVIPTNRAKNTIDALPPTSHLTSTAQFVTPNMFKLSWNGNDDPGGSGVASYSLYVSVNGGPYSLYRSGITENSILFTGLRNASYCFFTTAKDSVNNEEALKNTCELAVSVAGSPLPLTWLDFSGVRRGDDALLNWITANEINVQSFTVERSLNGSNFTALSIVGANGNSTGLNHYTYTDAGITRLGVDLIYYRIKQTDNNGQFSYSKTVVLRVENNAEPIITAYPNPFDRNITLQVTPASGQDKTNSVELYSAQGVLLYRKEISKQGTVTITLNDLPNLAAGLYMLRTTVNGVPYISKMVKN